MASLNLAMLIGHLGRDPEQRDSAAGVVCNFSVATDESYIDKNSGQKVQKTEWHRVVAFAKLAENCAKYLHKGSLVYVEGNLQTRKWQDQQGQDRFTTEIRARTVKFLDRKEDGGAQSAQRDAPQSGGQPGYDIDDVPF